MTTDSHCRGLEKSHKVKKEDAKENGILRQMNDEEYEREKAEIIVHLEVLMEILQRNEKDQSYGWTT